MEPRRLLLVALGAAAALGAGLPAAFQADAPTLTAAAAAAPVPTAGLTERIPTTKTHRGTLRHFTLHVPDGLLAPAPLVVALHAHSHTTDRLRAITRLEALADAQGFVVAFPEGAAGSWNADGSCRPATADGTDDVAFLDEVIALSRTRALIDPGRIHLTGASNGSMLALRYACERADAVASVAVVSGVVTSPCVPSQPVDVLLLHGEKDGVVPLAGGTNASLGVTFPPVDRSLAPFRDAAGDVHLHLVTGVGHTWMTRPEHGLDATEVVWSWLRDHPQPDVNRR